MAPAFERYFIKAIRDAMPRIRPTAAREEANRFCMQEGQHARPHTDAPGPPAPQAPRSSKRFATR